jgi:adenosylcobinamide-GDP ribazoletransferase
LLFRSFLVALAFLTLVPIRFRKMPTADIVAASRFWFPLVALLLGASLGLWTALVAAWRLSPLLASFFILVVWVAATGALHLDGFCDLCDGLFGGHSPEDRLRIMKDPHLGNFALAGGVLLILGKFAALDELILHESQDAPWLVASSVLLARCLALCMAGFATYPRPEGTGKVLVDATHSWETALYAAVGVGAVLVTPAPWTGKAAILFLAPCAVVVILTWVCRRRLGGVTGDCLGAAIESAEVVFLLAAAAI